MAESPGFTGLGAPSFPGFPVSPLPGQCINSQPWLRALTHCVAPLMRGRPGRWRRRPVLLACRQWDPLRLTRRLPSLGVGAWRCAPLLPWRVQCPVCVCAVLAAGSGGSGQYLVLCLSRFPLPAPGVLRCVWRAVPSGCPLPSRAGTPFWAVCAFRALGPVALLVVPACPLRVCVLALPRRPLPPLLGGVACAPRAVPALGAGRALPRGPCPSACPAPVPCSVWRAWGGAVWSRFPPTWLGVMGLAVGRPRGGCLLLLRGASGDRRFPSPDCPPTGRAVGVRYPRAVGAGVRLWGPSSVPSACTPCEGCGPRGGSVAFVCRGARWGGGVRRTPCLCGQGGPVGRGVALPCSVPLPSRIPRATRGTGRSMPCSTGGTRGRERYPQGVGWPWRTRKGSSGLGFGGDDPTWSRGGRVSGRGERHSASLKRRPMSYCPGPCAPPLSTGATARGSRHRGNASPHESGAAVDSGFNRRRQRRWPGARCTQDGERIGKAGGAGQRSELPPLAGNDPLSLSTLPTTSPLRARTCVERRPDRTVTPDPGRGGPQPPQTRERGCCRVGVARAGGTRHTGAHGDRDSAADHPPPGLLEPSPAPTNTRPPLAEEPVGPPRQPAAEQDTA